jgi:uncharacterized RDD family membrane protein YckC
MDPHLPAGGDPYAPPKTDVNADALPPSGDVRLADRGTRLAAAIIDGLLYMCVLIPLIVAAIHTGAFNDASNRPSFYHLFVDSTLGLLSLAGWLALLALQAYLVATTGQSIAKRLFNIRIVKVDGSPAGFTAGVLIRNWLIVILQQIPVVNMVLPWIDALLIFRQDRRCLHDLLAGTKVINAH